MVLLTPDVAPNALPQQEVAAPRPSVIDEPPKSPIFLQRKFRSTGSTGQELDKKGLPTGKKQERETTKNEEVESTYTELLTNHLSRLAGALERQPGLKDRIQAKYQEELTLLEQLSNDKGIPDDTAIKNYINTPAGRIAATIMLEKLDFKLSAGLGLNPTLDPSGKRITTSTPMRVPIAEQGILNKIRESLKTARGRVQFLAGSAFTVMEGTVLGAYVAAGAPLTPQAGIAVLGLPATLGLTSVIYRGMEAMRASWNKGRFLDLKPDRDVFDAIKNDAIEREYFLHVLNLDVGRLDLDANNRLVIATTGAGTTEMLRSNRQFADLQQEVTQHFYARSAFFESIGVDPASLDAGPQQAILDRARGKASQPEMSNVDYANEVRQKFEELGGVGNIQQTLEREDKAMSEVLGRYVAESLTKELSENQKGRRSELEQKKTSITSETGKQQRTQEATAKSTALGAKKSKLEQKQASLTTLKQNEKEVEQFKDKLFDEFKLRVTTDVLTTISDEIIKLEGELNTAFAVGPGLEDQFATASTDWLATYQRTVEEETRTRSAALGARGTVNMDAVETYATKVANTTHGKKVEYLEKKIKERQDRIDALNKVKDDFEKAQKEEEQAQIDAVRDVPKELVATRKAYDDFVSAGAATITPHELDTMTVEELIPLATVPPYSLANTTPEEKAKLRDTLLRAKAEHKAGQIETYNPGRASDILSYNDVTTIMGATTPITPNMLLTLPDQQLDHILSTNPAYAAVHAALPAGRTMADVRKEAKRQAQHKLRIRHEQFLEEQIKDIDLQMKAQEKIIEEKGETKPIEDAIDVADMAMARQGEIICQAYKITPSNTERINRLTDTIHITNTDVTYTQEERTAGLSKSYYEMLNLFFDYQRNATTRAENFEKIRKVLPPDKLAELLDKSLLIGIVGPVLPGTYLDIILPQLEARLSAGTIRPNQLHKAFESVVYSLEAEARVL